MAHSRLNHTAHHQLFKLRFLLARAAVLLVGTGRGESEIGPVAKALVDMALVQGAEVRPATGVAGKAVRMSRVEVTRVLMPADWGIYALCYMQVCAIEDATDEEILEVCNWENRSGTSNGWSYVVRTPEEDKKNLAPVVCEDDEHRLHYLVAC